MGPFMITNLLPASVCLCGCIPFGCSLIVWFMSVSAIEEGADVETVTRRLNWMPLVAIPGACFFSIAVQWMGAASVYWYHEMTYFQAILVASSERQSDIYFQEIYSMVLSKATWLTELINEFWP